MIEETRVTIDRPPAEVFAFVSDQCKAPLWQSGLLEVRRLTAGAIGVGTEHAFVRTFVGRRITSRNRFVTFLPGEYVEFEIPFGRTTGTASYRTEATESGTTILTSRLLLRVRGVLSLLEPLLTHSLINESRRDDQRLKRLLEHNV